MLMGAAAFLTNLCVMEKETAQMAWMSSAAVGIFQGCVVGLTAVLPLIVTTEGFVFQFLFLLVRRGQLLNRPASVRRFFVRIYQIASLHISFAMDAETVLMEVMKTTVWLSAKTRVCQFNRWTCALVGAL